MKYTHSYAVLPHPPHEHTKHIRTLMSANLDTLVSVSKGRALEYSQWKFLAALVTVDRLLLALWLLQPRHSLQKVQGAQC